MTDWKTKAWECIGDKRGRFINEVIAANIVAALEQAIAAVRAENERLRATPTLSHDDLCHLSHVFVGSAGLWTEKNIRINEWLKQQIAHAAPAPPQDSGNRHD